VVGQQVELWEWGNGTHVAKGRKVNQIRLLAAKERMFSVLLGELTEQIVPELFGLATIFFSPAFGR
jgi:hypothetical protein